MQASRFCSDCKLLLKSWISSCARDGLWLNWLVSGGHRAWPSLAQGGVSWCCYLTWVQRAGWSQLQRKKSCSLPGDEHHCIICEICLQFCSLLGGSCMYDRTFPWKFRQPLVSTEAYSKPQNCQDQKSLLSLALTTLSAELFHFVLYYSPQIKYLRDGKSLTINQNIISQEKAWGECLEKERSFLNLYIIYIYYDILYCRCIFTISLI